MARKTSLFILLALLLLSVAAAVPPQAGEGAYASLRRQAEQFYEEKSFGRAREVYLEAARLQLTPEEKRWVEFRLADTAWRADAASPSNDPTGLEMARAALETIARSNESSDRIRAEANESLGDLHLTHPRYHNPSAATPWYTAALDYWAGSDEIELARRRYLAIVFRMTENYMWATPREVLANALRIVKTPEERAHVSFLFAQVLLNEGRPESRERAFELLDEVARDRKSRWHDDALALYANHIVDEEPLKALELYRRLVAEYARHESPFRDDAERMIVELTTPSLSAGVVQTFVPGSEQEIYLHWRNIKEIELTLYAVDLTEDAALVREKDWVESIAVTGKPVVRRWTFDTQDKGEHRPGNEIARLTPRLEPGAYVLMARAGQKSARALLLVTDAHILVHSAAERMQLFVSDVETGEPIANARLRVIHDQGKATTLLKTGADGLTESKNIVGDVLITANAGAGRQAFHRTYGHWSGREARHAEWRVYAFTDRPAYRPEETVQWKVIARTRSDEQWATPANRALTYEIMDPRGQKVSSGTAKFNAFGSFWGELPLTPAMTLGAYTITFREGDRHAGSAQLFRLEEYKLPEFVVTVSTPENTQYRLGDTIEATIDASYYFGGPVANAEVQVVVHQSQFHRYWFPWREYPWYYESSVMPRWRQHETIVTRETLRTDARGRAVLRIETPRDGNDLSYRIEARVVDASRREVRGEGTVRVTRQRYSVIAQPEHYLHRPGDSVSVKFKAMDANDRPVRTTGTVRVVRRRWEKRGPVGISVRTHPGPHAGNYIETEVTTTKLDTDAAGEATFTFTPREAGYYAVLWTSVDGDPKRVRDLVKAETTIWVADRATTDIGYFDTSGVNVIVDKETMRAGETANVLLATATSGRWIVLTTSAGGILETRVIHMDGNVKLVQVPLDDRHVPNFFITASSVFERAIHTETERIVVPPVEHFLTVDVKADKPDYEPRQEGTLTVTTRDAAGKPVAAEVALAVSDEAVTAIQQDTAGDPRAFFYGELRPQMLQVSGSAHSQRYAKIDEKEKREELTQARGDAADTAAEGAATGYIGDAVQEAITVTASAPPASRMMKTANQVGPAPPPPPPAPAPVAPHEAPPQGGIDVQVRSDFRSTAFWKPDIVTDASGTASVQVKFPEALTTWRATARAATTGSAFGIGTSTARTNLPLLVRLQGPRFFVVGDRVTVSAVINNNTGQAMTVTPTLEVEGLSGGEAIAPVQVPAHGDARADWTVTAEWPGTAKLRVTARGGQHGDAMEKTFVVYEHGIDKLIARSGKLRGAEALVRLELPRERRATDLTIQVAPSLATAMLDALPYLLEFPYGCTEQTMSRFLPAAIVARTVERLGLGKAGLPDLEKVTQAGLTRLYDMQHSSGAWGWWKEGRDDEWMTAYVVWGMALAREGELPMRRDAVNRAAAWLERQLVEFEGNWNQQAWMLHALSAWNPGAPSPAIRRAYDDVWNNRERLTSYSRALFALTAHRYDDAERASVMVRNLEDGVRLEKPADDGAEAMSTARWGAERFWWRWYDSPVETTAFVLQALVTIDPKHRLVEPAMNWLVKNRRGSRWDNTRDTAISLLSLNEYLERSGELRGDVAYEVSVNGKVVATKSIAAADVLRTQPRISVDPALLKETTQEIRIRRTSGAGPLYFAAEARFVSLEEPVKAAGNEVFVKREYFRLQERPTLLKGVLYDKVPLRDGESIASGDRVEVVVTIDSKNDYEYLLFEDLKPGGLEAVELQSGAALYAREEKQNLTAWVYQELRDRKVALFIDKLPQGTWQIRYTMRAEVPGSFHALPVVGGAMYVPEIKGNSDELRLTVR